MKNRLAALAATLVLVASACGTPEQSEPLKIIGIWTGAEEDVFRDVLNGSGIDYVYTGGRNLDQLLQSELRNGSEPDVAVVSSPADLAGYLQDDALRTLPDMPQEGYAQAWRNLVQDADGQQYAVVLKADLKSIVWYNPGNLPAGLDVRNPTWDSLIATTEAEQPWCMGLGAGPASGFPGTDWISSIMLRGAGPQAYTAWVRGDLAWSSPEVRRAFTRWGTILRGVHGGSASALLTRWDTAGLPMFGPGSGCRLDGEGSFVTGQYVRASSQPRAGEDFDFFTLPAIQEQGDESYVVGANFAGLFRDSARGRELMAYLAGPQAQGRWAGNGAFSVKQDLPDNAYDDPVSETVAGILTQAQDSTARLCFGAADAMSPTMRAAFYQAVLAYAADSTDGDTLDRLLTQLDRAQAAELEQAQEQGTAGSQIAVCGGEGDT